MNYLMLTQVKGFFHDTGEITIESAFWNHVVLLSEKLAEKKINLALAINRTTAYESTVHNSSFVKVNPKEYGIEIYPNYVKGIERDSNKLKKICFCLTIFKHISSVTKKADLVHTGLSYDSYLPTSFFALLSAILKRKFIVYVVDIDFRQSSRMLYETKEWSLATYIFNKATHDVFKHFQVYIGAKNADLCLLKGEKFAADYQKISKNAHSFYDTVHSKDNVISLENLESSLELKKKSSILNLVYFGRVVKYKGLQDFINLLPKLISSGFTSIKLTIIGEGEYKEELLSLAKKNHVDDFVRFLPPIEYGRDLIQEISKYDALIALPQRQDTPRSAFDAMAAGIPVLAYDIDYYKEISKSRAVYLSPWLNHQVLGSKIMHLSENKSLLNDMSYAARQYALENSHESWVDLRVGLTMQAVSNRTTSSQY